MPGKNDLTRLEPARQGKVQFAENDGGTFLAQKGVLSFTDQSWEPQKVRVLLNNLGSGGGLALGVSKTTCEKAGKPGCEDFTLADLKGLRVPLLIAGATARYRG